MIIKPAIVSACTDGIIIKTMPAAIIASPARISVLSENLSVKNPFTALPDIMPIKNRLANIAARSAVIEL